MGRSVNAQISGIPIDFQKITKTITFTGAANLGAIGNVPIFAVTGAVLIFKAGNLCRTTCAGATATISYGTTSATAQYIAATTATTITAGLLWVDATPAAVENLANAIALGGQSTSEAIVGTVAVAAITSGAIDFTIYWMPLTDDGSVS